MYGAILGDIIGEPYEFDGGNKTKNFPMFSERPSFTDDSVMTVAIADGILKAGLDAGEESMKDAMIKSMHYWGHKYPHAGYGGKFYFWLLSENTEPYNSWGNGSAMRVSSVGWFFDTLERTREVARWSAEVTHNHPEGIKGAEATASVIWMARNGYFKTQIKEYVEKEFGTGAVKITPAHDPNDFEVGVRCNLPVMRVFTDDGHINELGGRYEGLTTMECRKKLVEDIEAAGNLVKIEPYGHNVGTCYRCHSTVEPLVSKQWFVSMKPLAKPAIDVVRSGEIRFVPERFDKTYYNWMENIRDWCISRQLWWGHRIPAYYCDDCGETIVAETAPERCPKCGGKLHQDEDVLDTWFSSGMWPFSTLGWPEKTKELDYFYPTSTLVTGYDIIFFWVARMIVFGMEVMHQKPFSTVYIHGLVRDEQGRKMSKSLGNGVDPLEIIKQYGADSLRFSLVTGNGAGGDMRFGTKKVEAARNFCNKLYNAARFVLMNIGDAEVGDIDISRLDIADKWILNRLNTMIREITANMDSFDLNLAAQKIYDFVWTEFCDWYIELAKPRMNGTDEEQKANVRAIRNRVLMDSLKLLHPFMPFITEELYLNLPNAEETIMRSAWPKAKAEWDYPEEAETMEEVMDLIRATRNIRAEMNVPPSRKLKITLVTHGAGAKALEACIPYIMKLAGAEHVAIQQDKHGIPENAVSAVAQAAEAFIPLSDLIDVDKERERLNKEAEKVKSDIARSSGKLNNQGFVAKAPEKVIAEERKKLAAAEDMLKKLEARLEQLNNM